MPRLKPWLTWRQQHTFEETLELAEFDEADVGDGFDLAQGFDGCVRNGCVGDVDLHNGEGLALGNALGARGSAQSEVGDVDAVIAEDGADAADDAGDVMVADGDESAVEGRFDVDAVIGKQARRGAVQDGG